jgi:uncharacterized protein YqjF (DUF2071 family)
MAFPKHLLQQQQHRPFPPPVKPWFSRQLWENLLFYNVAVDAGALQATLPKGMLVDCYNGRGWLSIVPFQLSMGLRGFPSCFWPLTFNELNVRTYVTVNGKPGIYFYSLDANDWFSVTMARLIFKLNYFNAHIDMAIGESIFINAQRAHQGMPKSIFNAQYAPTGNIFHPKEGSLEDWLEGKIDLNQYLVKNPAATYLLRVSGDSMKDAGIHSGDVLVVDCAKEAKHGDIIIACLDGEMTVKRLYRKGSKTALVPENELYNPITITGESDFTIWGVVVSCLKQF